MKELKKHKQGRIFLLLLGMFLAGILYSCSQPSPGTEVSLEYLEDGERREKVFSEPEAAFSDETADCPGKETAFSEAKVASEAENSEEEQIWVHVCGQVAAPGVYSLNAGSRVFQALEAAGGILEQGDGSILNLAMVLEDGMRIEVPDRTEAERLKTQGILSDQAFVTDPGDGFSGSPGKSASTGRKVNLNKAGVEELMTLTGIGKSRAEAIIQYRQEVGPFRSIEDIMNVSGIKESAFEKIRDDITV